MQRPRSHRAWAFLLGCVIAGAFGAACEVVSHSSDFQTATTATDAVTCPATELLCTSDAGPSCIDPTSDSTNCGRCGTTCPATQVCSAGVCGCAAGQTSCGGACVDTKSSPSNCGSCGTTCGANQICSDKACVAQCPAGFENCDNECVDLATSRANCGACKHGCTAGATCSQAADAGDVSYECCVGCGCDTDAGQIACDSGCADISNDPVNCGACGKSCGAGETCTNGACVCGTTSSSSGQTYISCDGGCVGCPIAGNTCVAGPPSASLPGLPGKSQTTSEVCGCAEGLEPASDVTNGQTACCARQATVVKCVGNSCTCCNLKGSICCAAGMFYCPKANGCQSTPCAAN